MLHLAFCQITSVKSSWIIYMKLEAVYETWSNMTWCIKYNFARKLGKKWLDFTKNVDVLCQQQGRFNSAVFKITCPGVYFDAVGKLLHGFLMDSMRILRSIMLVHSEYLCWYFFVFSSFFWSSDLSRLNCSDMSFCVTCTAWQDFQLWTFESKSATLFF